MLHKHHIKPRHMGGDDAPDNLVKLSVVEHAEAHRVLYEKYGKEEDRIAWLALSGMITKLDAIAFAMRAKHLGNKNGMFGKHHSEATRKKIADKLKGNIPWIKGKHLSAATREKLSKAHLGKKVSEATREKLRVANLGNRGKFLSKETRAKMSFSKMGNKNSVGNKSRTGMSFAPEVIEKIRAASTGKIPSAQTIEKIRQSNIGKKRSSETKERIKVAALLRWAKKRLSK